MGQDPSIRTAFFTSAGSHVDLVAAEIDETLLLVPTHDDDTARSLFETGAGAGIGALRRVVAVLRALDLWRGDGSGVVVDVGAGLGARSVSALLRHGAGSVVACEPSADNVALLRANLLLNDVGARARVLQVVVSDRTWIPEPDDTSAAIETVTLDALAARRLYPPGRVGLLWLGAAGCDPGVLEGARSLTDRATPVVVELDRSSGSDAWLERLAPLTNVPYSRYVNLDDPALSPAPVDEIETLLGQPTADPRGARLLFVT